MKFSFDGVPIISDIYFKSPYVPSEQLCADNIFHSIHIGDLGAVYFKITTKKININLRNERDQTLLHYALLYNQTDIAKILIYLGANTQTTDIEGRSVQKLIKERDFESLFNEDFDALAQQVQDLEASTSVPVSGADGGNNPCCLIF